MGVSYKIIKTVEFNDYVRLVNIYGQGCNYPTKQGIDGFQIDFTVEVKDKLFNITFQNMERLDNIMAYNGYEMSLATQYGYAGDESQEFINFCIKHEIEGHEEFLGQLKSEAESFAQQELFFLKDGINNETDN